MRLENYCRKRGKGDLLEPKVLIQCGTKWNEIIRGNISFIISNKRRIIYFQENN